MARVRAHPPGPLVSGYVCAGYAGRSPTAQLAAGTAHRADEAGRLRRSGSRPATAGVDTAISSADLMLHLLIRKSPNPMITTAEPQATASGLQMICLQLRCDEHGTAGGHGRRHRRIGVSQAQFHRDYLCRDTATVSRFAVLYAVDGQRHCSGPRDGTMSGDGCQSCPLVVRRRPPLAPHLRLFACGRVFAMSLISLR